ncbi:Pre-mRNA-splicing factor [Glutinoglossum americanum]|uniref:Pre-mRNA-splicing factor CWC2 n=1 Tax=Glutinoglossum americanum TaxID=1670608 RepID=A0A9P8L237_9PEZI|nr:Pre-mRNA-splicing factor [Glutinoglossum americanum]
MAEIETATPIPLDSQPGVDGATNNQELALSESTQDGEKKVVKKVIKKKRRPARPQVDLDTLKSGELPPQTGTVFNIWYNKWSGGDREDKYASKVHAESRCNIARDSGYTRADKVPGSYFCLFFARGLCPKGHECEYLHRLPTIHDLFNPNIDCFGRDKHSDYRDDMGGVGSFMRQNRTLYVGRIHVSDDIEEIVARHFTEWGQIERIRVLNSRGVAFITYTNEASSQFAKEAMAHQSLDHNEILNVRWATVDPNPMAQAREKRKIEEQAAEAVRRALPADFVAEIEGKDPEARKRKRIEGGFGLVGYDAPDEVWYARGSAAINPSGRQTAMIESSEQQPLTITGEEEERENGGIISDSTLAALKNYSMQNKSGIVTSQAPRAAVSSGPLVAYGSDDSD